MTFPTIKEIVERYDLHPKKSLGQNFIFDLDLTDRIVQAAGDLDHKSVLEIGPGAGSLSRVILDRNIKCLTALEHDSRCIKALSYLKKYYLDKFELIEIDALRFKVADHFSEKVIIISNLPYNIGTELFFKWIDEIHLIDKMVLMFQKEVANRLLASVGDNNYGKLSIVADLFFDRYKHLDLPPEVFHPAPKVDSSVVVFKANPTKYVFNYKRILQLISISFSQRRKKIRNTISQILPNVDELFELYKITKDARPQDLSTLDYVNLSNHISK
jgi:16S rRNA (adenine1518-N6/adenine1519-N6)-dimethyltransferase